MSHEQKTEFNTRIRSFVKREGRLTPGQQRAMRDMWPQYGIEYTDENIKWADFFGRPAPLAIDIGFGNGESLTAMAEALPDWNCLGIEVHRPGVGGCLLRIAELGISNVRVLCHDAYEVLEYMVPPRSVNRICIFYPDPWHKKRHHKRRLVNLPLLDLAHRVLDTDGELHLVTDWQDYAEHMCEVVALHNMWDAKGNSPIIERPHYRPITKYERRGLRLGHAVHEFLYTKRS